MIHPFKDGNGRSWRCVFWQMLSERYDEVQVLLIMVYLKLINNEGLYQAQYLMRKGDLESFVSYWGQCIDWSRTGHGFYQDIFSKADTNSLMAEQICELDYYLKAEKRDLELY
ncbi:MAG: hypothetical protein L3J52_10740 [Proteobacteria bacterium]|nr:hypothetical protein [Pseudomonadota bacterium]